MFKIVAPVFVLGLLTSCAGFSDFVTKADTDVANACTKVLPLAKIASLMPGIPASIAAYVIAGCETAAGFAKLRANPDSVAWLDKIAVDLQKVTK